MQFIQDNYVWFIIGAIVILMAVIGYFADKTDFGRKQEPKVKEPKPKKEKKAKEQKEDKIEIDAKGIGELTQSIAERYQEENIEPQNKQPEVENDLYAPLENSTMVNNETVDESLYAPLTDAKLDAIPIEEQSTEELNNEVVEPIATEPELENIPVDTLPLEEPIVVNEDDDIWKF